MSKVIVKIKYSHPNLKGFKESNVAYMKYIATRPGVDKEVTEQDLNKELNKCNFEESDNETYIKYIDERPGSHGLFGQTGIENPKIIQEEIKNVNSYVWRMIISLKEADAQELGYLNKTAWQNMLRKKMLDFADELKIGSTNIRWVAAVHMEKGHPHAHVMFWEKNPKKVLGQIYPKALNKVRKMFTDEIFEEKRFMLLQEKNTIRDLIRDIAKDDISKTVNIIKELKSAEKDIQVLDDTTVNKVVPPKLHDNIETKLINMICDLSQTISDMNIKGRIAYKLMPKEVKEKVDNITKYLISQPLFDTEINRLLNSVEKMVNMYTGKENDIKRSQDNALEDIIKRINQVVLKGAVAVRKKNYITVNTERAKKAADVIINNTNSINLYLEYKEVFPKIIANMYKVGIAETEMIERLNYYCNKNNLSFDIEQVVKESISKIEKDNITVDLFEDLSPSKFIDYYLGFYKSLGYDEENTFILARKMANIRNNNLKDKLDKYVDEGLLVKGKKYHLMHGRIEDFIKEKYKDKAELEIFNMLEQNDKITFDEIFSNSEVMENLYDFDPDEFQPSNFDKMICRRVMDEDKFTFDIIKDEILKKYTDDNNKINIDEVEKETSFYYYRIGNLCLNGYLALDKKTNLYTLTDEGESLINKRIKMDFTRYDANVTLSYFEKMKSEFITGDELKDYIFNNTINEDAKNVTILADYIINKRSLHKLFEVKGNEITLTRLGKKISYELYKLNQYFDKDYLNLNINKVKEKISYNLDIDIDKEKELLDKLLDKYVKNGYVKKCEDGEFILSNKAKVINNMFYIIYKSKGINIEDIPKKANELVHNRNASKHYKYMIKRLNNLEKLGYIYKPGKSSYKLLNEAIEKKKDLLEPKRVLLKDKLKYLEHIEGIEGSLQEGFSLGTNSEHFNSKAEKEKVFESSINRLLNNTRDNIDLDKIQRTTERMFRGKEYNDVYEDVNLKYEDIKKRYKATDYAQKALINTSTVLFYANYNKEQVLDIIKNWNNITKSNIKVEKIEEAVEKSYKIYEDKKSWGEIKYINEEDWEQFFHTLGIKKPPNNIYDGIEYQNNYNKVQGINAISVINQMWKGAWNEINKQKVSVDLAIKRSMERDKIQNLLNTTKEVKKVEYQKSKYKTLFNEHDIEDKDDR